MARNGRFTPGHALKKIGKVPSSRTGTRVRFWPDSDIFDPDASIDYDEVRERLGQVCFLVPGLKIRLADKRKSSKRPTEEFVSKGGLSDYVDFLSGETQPVTGLIRVEGVAEFLEKVPVDGKLTEVTRECQVDIALRWVQNYETRIVSFVNTIPTPDGGTHVAGFERSLTTSVNQAITAADPRKLRKLKDDAKVQKEDAQEGLIAVVRAVFPEPHQGRIDLQREVPEKPLEHDSLSPPSIKHY